MSFERGLGPRRGSATGTMTGSPLGSLATGGLIVGLLAAAGIWAAWHLRLDPAELVAGRDGWQLATDFFGRALSPAWHFEGPYQGGTGALPLQALHAVLMTVMFAATSLSLALAGGLLLGFLGSFSLMRGRLRPLVTPARLLSNLLRAVHDLIWAVLLLAAFGRSPLIAVLAIALPYTGTLARIFAELMDETPADAADALTWSGATSWQRFAFGILPRALPEMIAYVFYRFECALRSAAVLGFFGFPTLGYYLAASFENLYFGEVWTYLYVLLGVILLVDWWSGRLRQELIS